MKAYPVTTGELWGLGGVGLAASAVFSGGASAIGFSIETAENLALSQAVPAETAGYWGAAEAFAWWGGIALLILGVGLVLSGGLYIRHIINRTDFGDE
jgi:hypothetical protein